MRYYHIAIEYRISKGESYAQLGVFVNNKLSQSDHFKSEPLLESEFP
jgi:hypothetical protein